MTCCYCHLQCFAEEFPAHVGNVNCLALGHKSVRVMVTGGEDRKVNMWAIGKPNCILVCFLLHLFLIISAMKRKM